jgi:hypothetical protein
MVNDSVRGFVFSFSGANYLSLNPNQQFVTQTRTFWLSSPTSNAGNGAVFDSTRFVMYFNSGTLLKFYPNFQGGLSGFSNVGQGTTWIFYAVTLTETTMNIYVNGSFVTSVLNTWTGENSEFQFGAYSGRDFYTGLIDDMRLYPLALTATQILDIYNGL